MLRLPKVEYLVPKSVEEACSLSDVHKEKAKVIAGGTDLLVMMKRRLMEPPQYLIGLKNIPELSDIRYDEKEGLKIGALVTLSSLCESSIIGEKYPVLGEAASYFGAVEVRNMGTVGGNLCSAAPSADTAPPLLALGAKVKLAGASGVRTVPLEEFFTGPFENVLRVGEIMTEIQVPVQRPHTAGAFVKVTRTGMGLAVVNVAVVLTLEERTCKEIKIALGACAPTPWRAKKAEEIIRGKKISDRLIEQASLAASEASRPRSVPAYKKELVGVLSKRAIREAISRAEAV